MNCRSASCSACGEPIAQGWRFCAACGHLLGSYPWNENSKAPKPAQFATPISPEALPNVSGVPGRIVGIKVSHGWAATCGYYDVHEVADGLATKTRKISPARGGGRFPEGWFDECTAQLSSGDLMMLEVILQNVRYCDIGKSQDGTTVVEPRNRNLFMRITFEDFDGSLKTFDVHADAEYGQDVGSPPVRDVQLEESRYYFLTVYFNEDGTPMGDYSFDMEGAHDAHYRFTESEVPRLRRLMGASGSAPLADAMIAFLRERTGGELSGLIWQIKTGSISY